MKKNIWLFLEMVAVTIVSWVVLFPTIDALYNYPRPIGYDKDRLVTISWTPLVNDYHDYELQLTSIVHRLEELPEVECGYIGNYQSLPIDRLNGQIICAGADTIYVSNVYVYNLGRDCFRTLGIKTLDGSTSADSLSVYNWEHRGRVLTQSAAIGLFGTPKVAGRQIKRQGFTDEYESMTIAAVVEDIRAIRYDLNSQAMFEMNHDRVFGGYFILRLHEGVSPERFMTELSNQLPLYRNKAISLQSIKTMDQLSMKYTNSIARQMHLYLIMTVFFLINLVLGVIGSFWLKTRSRRSEVGIRRSFGASRLRIVWLFLRQALWLASMAIVVGTLLYLAYCAYEWKGLGFITGFDMYPSVQATTPSSHTLPLPWICIRWLYHLVVFAIIYLLMALTITIGVTIPAWTLTRQKPIESLKEE